MLLRRKIISPGEAGTIFISVYLQVTFMQENQRIKRTYGAIPKPKLAQRVLAPFRLHSGVRWNCLENSAAPAHFSL